MILDKYSYTDRELELANEAMSKYEYFNYLKEDISRYKSAKESGYIDDDNDYLIGDSGGLLPKEDFIFIDTYKFQEVSLNYIKNEKLGVTGIKAYCNANVGTKEYKTFWQRESQRRKIGCTERCKLYKKDIPLYNSATTTTERNMYLHPIRITGDHYNTLNYSRISRTPTEKEREELDRIGNFKQTLVEGFPRFWDGHYWNCKADEFAVRNKQNSSKAKARGKGYSYITSAQMGNTLNNYPNSILVLTSFDADKYLFARKGTANMVMTNLRWLDNKTYFKRGIGKEDISDIVLGFKESKGGHEIKGWLSELVSGTCRGQSVGIAVSKRALEVTVEEAGTVANLDDFMNLTTSSIEVGSSPIGIIRLQGTGGLEDKVHGAFQNIFYNPKSNNFTEFENIHDNGARHTVCGFFHPQVKNLEPFIDGHGNSLLEEAFIYDYVNKLKAKANKSDSDFIIYLGQRANCPSEAFNTGQENIFTSKELILHYKDLIDDDKYKYYEDGTLIINQEEPEFISNIELKRQGKSTSPYITKVPFDINDSTKGCIRKYYKPKNVVEFREADRWDNTTNISYMKYPNILFYDPVGKSILEKDITTKHSLASALIFSKPNQNDVRGKTLIAGWIGRHSTLEEDDRHILNLAKWAKASVLCETDRGTCVDNFKKWGEKGRLEKDPSVYLDGNLSKVMTAPYGMNIGGGTRKQDGLMLLHGQLYERMGTTEYDTPIYFLHYIHDVRIILEVLKFRLDGNFDYISSLILFAYYFHSLSVRKKDKIDNTIKKKRLFDSLNLYGSSH